MKTQKGIDYYLVTTVKDEFGRDIDDPKNLNLYAHIVVVELRSGWVCLMDSRRVRLLPASDPPVLIVMTDLITDDSLLYDPQPGVEVRIPSSPPLSIKCDQKNALHAVFL